MKNKKNTDTLFIIQSKNIFSKKDIFPLIKGALFTFLPLLILIAISTMLIYYTESTNEKTIIRSKETDVVDVLSRIITSDFDQVTSDLMILSSGYELHKLFDTDLDNDIEITDRLLVVAQKRKIYDQLTFIDETGKEATRINYIKDKAYIVPRNKLQSKINRYYFDEIFNMVIGNIYVSPFDLSVENGKIELPIKPVIRFGTPVFDKMGRKRGVLVMHYLGNKILSDIEMATVNSPGQIMLLNSAGFWLKGDRDRDEWGFMYKDRQKKTLKNLFPEASIPIYNSDFGEFYNKDGLFTFTTIYPLKEIFKTNRDNNEYEKKYYWKIVSRVPNDILNARSRVVFAKLINFDSFLLLILSVISIFASYTTIKHKKADEMLKWELKINSAIAKLSSSLLTKNSINEISSLVMKYTKELTDSLYGFVGYVEPKTGYLAFNTMNIDILQEPKIDLDHIVFRKISGLWGWALRNKKSLFTNKAGADPRGTQQFPLEHKPIQRFLSAPAMIGDSLVGQIAMANAPRDYNERDLILVERMADLYAIAIQRRRNEEEIIRLAAIVESSDDAIIGKTLEGIILSWNKGAEKLYGYVEDEIVGQHIATLFPSGEYEEFRPILDEIKTGGHITHYETRRIKKDGTVRDISLTLSPIKDVNDKITGISAIERDITERKIAETRLQETMTELERSNMELAQFAYICSHDLQEPLRKIQTFADRFKIKWSVNIDEQGIDYLNRIQNAANRMQTLIIDLLEFSKVSRKAQPFVDVDMNKIAQDVISDLEVRIMETEADLQLEALPVIEADPLQMRQLFQNLIGNALKFRNPSMKPVIKIYSKKLSCIESNDAEGKLNEKEFYQFFIKDNGIGFAEKYLERIFVIFQRLHGRDEYEGTGIGLAICKKIVERHGGNITANSIIGEGATFVITLPAKQK